MRILDRYILKPLIATFFGCLLLFIFLYIISDLLSHLDEILKQKTSIEILLKFYITYLPIIFTQTSPIAILIATTYTFGKFNRDNELVAMRASGLSLWQITFPVIVAGALLSFSVFFVTEKLIPQAQVQAEKMKAIMDPYKKPKPKEEIINNLTFYGLGNRLFFVNSFDTKNNSMEGISILEHDNKQNLTAKILARKGVFQRHIWIFYDYNRYNFDPSGQIEGDIIYSPEQIMDITETPHDFLQQRKRPEFMSIAQLEDYIWRLKKSGATTVVRNLTVDLQQRYASSFSSLILVLVGIPFSFIIRRRANIFSSFGICIAISFLYYVATAISLALGKTGILPPILAAWLAPITVAAASINKMAKAS